MFKCKQCGRQFGANTPDHCPECGAKNRQPDAMSGGRFVSLLGALTLGCGLEIVLIGIVAGLVIALAIKYL